MSEEDCEAFGITNWESAQSEGAIARRSHKRPRIAVLSLVRLLLPPFPAFPNSMLRDTSSARQGCAPEPQRADGIEALHERLVDADPAAANDLAVTLLPILRRVVRQSSCESDPHVIEDGVEHALLTFLRNPAAYKSDRSSLVNWLAIMGRNRVRDLQRERRRRRLREVTYGIVPPATPVASGIDRPARRPLHVLRTLAMSVAVSGLERSFLSAKLAGERRTPTLANILEVGDLPRPEQRRLVKQTWDCLRARMRRLADSPHSRRD